MQSGPRGMQSGPQGMQSGPRGMQSGPRGMQSGPRGMWSGPRGMWSGPWTSGAFQPPKDFHAAGGSSADPNCPGISPAARNSRRSTAPYKHFYRNGVKS
jgi:hypothetical protein